jgi:hypothetical protein
MSGTTISTVETVGLVLSLASQCPVLITESGEIINKTIPASLGAGGYVSGIYDDVSGSSIINLGTVEADPVVGAGDSQLGVGVFLRVGGVITNGFATDTSALIAGTRTGVGIGYNKMTKTLMNFGTIAALGSEASYGVNINSNCSVTNGSNADVTALITDGNGDGLAAVSVNLFLTNYGTIYGRGGGVAGSTGGSVVNGSSLDGEALMRGARGYGLASAEDVMNYGTIEGASTNKYRFDVGLLVEGGGITITNKGTIVGFAGAFVEGGTFINDGVLEGTGGTALYSRGGLALDLDPGAVFVGGVTLADDCVLTLESGASAGTLAGFGTSITVNATISFAPEAVWTIAGDWAGPDTVQTINGFSGGDVIELTAGEGENWTYANGRLEFEAGPSFSFSGSAAPDLMMGTNQAAGYIEISAVGSGAVVGAGDLDVVPAGSTFSGLIIERGGTASASAGGTLRDATIAGGVLELTNGVSVTGGIHFSGTHGELLSLGTAVPSAAIFGFKRGDTIVVDAIPYKADARVTVKEAGIVTIVEGKKSYKLHIENAKVGEDDYRFGPGSVLTISGGPAMKFLRNGEESAQAGVPDAGLGVVEPASLSLAAAGGARGLVGLHEWRAEPAVPVVTLHGGY